jgi:hypothetical protein
VVVISPLVFRIDAEEERVREPPFGGEGDYPDDWKTSLEEARADLNFEPLMPDSPSANASNLTEVFASPEGHAVALRFPIPPLIEDAPLREEFLEIFESPWQGGDPAEAWAEDLEKSASSARVCLISRAFPPWA